jgi:hypothetical protein
MERLHPGVYIEEIPSGVRPIEGVSTSTAAFIGKAEMGPLNKAVLVTSVPEFEAKFGAYLNDSFLAHSAFQFFNNGGKKCYIVRVAGSGARAAEIAIKDRKAAPAKTLTIKAANEGAWGNKLDVVIADGSTDPDNEFQFQVFRDRSDLVPPLPSLLLETNDNLSMNPEANNFVEKVVNANSQYITVEVDDGNISTSTEKGFSQSGKLPVGDGAVALKLTAAQGAAPTSGTATTPGTLQSGATPSTNPLADQRKFRITINSDGPHEIVVPPEAATGDDIAAAIQKIVNEEIAANTPTNQPAFDDFTCIYDDTTGPNPFYLLTSGTPGTSSAVLVDTAPAGATAISLPAGQHKFFITINGDGPHLVSLTGPLADGNAIATAISSAVTIITPKRSINATAFASFACTYENGAAAGNPSLKLASGAGGANSSVRVTDATSENVAATLKLGLTNGGKEITGAANLRPAKSQTPTEYHLGDAVDTGNIVTGSVFAGDDGSTPGDLNYINGLTALDIVRDVNILSIPGIGSKAVVDAGTNYCTQRKDCFFIGDPNQIDDTVDEARDFLNGLTVKSSYGAIYYPWLKMVDPTAVSPEPISVPPSGFVAGMYARIDAKRGVWKAPAGTEANIGGATGLLADTTDTQQDFLNPIGVNVIRSFPASGIVIWGARTLATRSDPEYRYIPVRRIAIFLEQSIYNGIQWAVFEPNDEGLWSSLRLNIGAFMMLQFRAGAFQGKTPNDAFFVKCDNQTTTQADIDAGIVNILVGFAPLKPAEFVVLKLSQKAGQPAT